MKVVVPAEIRPGERRVALVPDAVPLLLAAGHEVAVQAGAGAAALALDAAYLAAGASVVDGLVGSSVDVLLHVRPLHPGIVRRLRPGAVTIGLCEPATSLPLVAALRDGGITALAVEHVPPTPRARAMDAVATQDSVAGYRAVLEAAGRLGVFLPRLTTAAGKVPGARVLVLGAGIAGLQAIATARRLGADVAAFDPRAGTGEEIGSVGGTTLDATDVEAHVRAADAVVVTGLALNRDAVASLRPGAVVVDLAGTVHGAVPGEEVAVPVPGGEVRVVALPDAASGLAPDASRLWSGAVTNLLLHVTRDGVVVPDLGDEIVTATCLVHDGAVRHAPTERALAAAGLAVEAVA